MIQRVTGTTDFYPEDKEIQAAVFNTFRSAAKKYGFREIGTPSMEYMDFLKLKYGEEMKQQIFTIEKKGSEELALIPDITVSSTRMFVQKQKEMAKPVKWLYIDKMWRYERPQQGRLREFYQFGVELFGSDKPEADAEIINLMADSLISLGLAKEDFVIKISNRKLLQGALEFIPKEKSEDVFRLIDKSSKMPEEDLEKELKKLNIDAKKVIKIIKIKTLEEVEKLKLNKLADEGYNELKNIFKFLKREYVQLDLSIARGIAYYTGTVFEAFDKKGKFRAIAGGGRYDNLVAQLGGEDCPAVGFGVGYSVLSLLLEEKGLLPKIKPEIDYYVLPVNEQMKEKANEIAIRLRQKNSVEIDLSGKSITKQLDYANKINAKKVVFIGPDELKSNEVKIKDMKTGKEERAKINLL